MGLVIALNKGRILQECLPLFAACGIEPDEDPDKSRKLIFNSRTGGHQLIITRSADVPTYVEHGVADVGVTGKDTILEYPDRTSGHHSALTDIQIQELIEPHVFTVL